MDIDIRKIEFHVYKNFIGKHDRAISGKYYYGLFKNNILSGVMALGYPYSRKIETSIIEDGIINYHRILEMKKYKFTDDIEYNEQIYMQNMVLADIKEQHNCIFCCIGYSLHDNNFYSGWINQGRFKTGAKYLHWIDNKLQSDKDVYSKYKTIKYKELKDKYSSYYRIQVPNKTRYITILDNRYNNFDFIIKNNNEKDK